MYYGARENTTYNEQDDYETSGLCRRCKSPHLRDDNLWCVCVSCGIVQSSQPTLSDDGVWTAWDSVILGSLKGYNRDPPRHREIYFKETVACVSNNGASIPKVAMYDIYKQLEETRFDRIRKDFIRSPSQRNTQRILRDVKPSKYLMRYYERKSKTIDFKRKNFIMKWYSLKVFLVKRYKLNEPIPLLPYDVFTVVVDCHSIIAAFFDDMRRSSGDWKKRTAMPSSKVFMYILLVLINPKIVVDYMDILTLPKVKTTIDNLSMITNMCVHAYGKMNTFMQFRKVVTSETYFLYHENIQFPVVQYVFFITKDGRYFEDVKKIYLEELRNTCQIIEDTSKPSHMITTMKSASVILNYILNEIVNSQK